ncbi:saccharopine dehydrogenase NADP-binding domain-containing protein [Larkinella soli]|uniref:saccharopine dehydrogenase NADP-binding domain-containing protein n=1 Tax=Larkinella soli TaxID=1770527 RepID=UPI000FFB2BC9|nr:saccharopine dehydrogenase NADP-binding domain-containing protein [Larkinella soli]
MNNVCILITGAGELGKAVGLFLTQHFSIKATYFVGDKDPRIARQAAQWIGEGNTQAKMVYPFQFDATQVDKANHTIFGAADLVVDCLPAPLTPHVARLARQHDAHYVNLTASADEIDQIQAIAMEAKTAFLLQAGVAPGLVNLLLKDLYQQYPLLSGWPAVDYAGIRVAVLPPSPMAAPAGPVGHCGFLSCREAILISNVRQMRRWPVSIWENNEINGPYTDASMMAGGEGNLVEALAERIRQAGHPLQHRTSRLTKPQATPDRPDWLLTQAIIEGYDASGKPLTLLKSCQIHPARIGHRWLHALQVGRVVLIAECINLLLTTHARGLIFLNQLMPKLLFKSELVQRFFVIDPSPEFIYPRSVSSDPLD